MSPPADDSAANAARSAPSIPPAAAVLELLACYQALLDAAASRGWRGWRAVGASAERVAADHVRRALAALERRYAANAALAGEATPETRDARERAKQQSQSLAPGPSRWTLLVLGGTMLVLVRVLIAALDVLVGRYGPPVPQAASVMRPGPHGELFGANPGSLTPDSDAAAPLVDAVSRVSDLSLGNVASTVDLLLASNVLVTMLVALVFGAAGYLVLRPFATAARRFRVLRHGDRVPGPPRFTTERGAARHLRVDEREEAVFATAGIASPPDPWADLAARLCLAVPLLVAGLAGWVLFLDAPFVTFAGETEIEGVVALTHDRWPLLAFAAALTATAATLWLVRLGHALGRRRAGEFAVGLSRGSALTALAALVALTGAFGLLALRDRRFPNVLARADPITTKQLHHRFFEMSYACDEWCTLSGPRIFVQGTGAAVIGPLALEFSEIPTLGESFMSDEERSSLTEEGVSLPRRDGEPVNVLLSPAQARQLARSLSPGEEAALFFTVSDPYGNRAAGAVMLTRSER